MFCHTVFPFPQGCDE